MASWTTVLPTGFRPPQRELINNLGKQIFFSRIGKNITTYHTFNQIKTSFHVEVFSIITYCILGDLKFISEDFKNTLWRFWSFKGKGSLNLNLRSIYPSIYIMPWILFEHIPGFQAYLIKLINSLENSLVYSKMLSLCTYKLFFYSLHLIVTKQEYTVRVPW